MTRGVNVTLDGPAMHVEHDLHRETLVSDLGVQEVIWCSGCPLYVRQPAEMSDFSRAWGLW